MKKNLLFCLCFLFSCHQQEDKTSHQVAPVKEPMKNEKIVSFDIQLPASARLPVKEEEFLVKFKAAIASKNQKALEALYYFEGADLEMKRQLPKTFEHFWKADVVKSQFKIEPDNEAAKNNEEYTVPYLGKLKIMNRGPAGENTTEVPIGIKDGHYFLTIGK